MAETHVELVGRRIRAVRRMADEELEREGWAKLAHGVAPVIELDDGATIYPARDEEGNGSGALFGATAAGDLVMIYPTE